MTPNPEPQPNRSLPQMPEPDDGGRPARARGPSCQCRGPPGRGTSPPRAPVLVGMELVAMTAVVPAEPDWILEQSPSPNGFVDMFPTVSLERFLAEPESDEPGLVDGIGLRAIGTNILGGPPKSLKTLLMSHLALCVSSIEDGEPVPFLDLPITGGGPVLFVEEEGGRQPFRRRISRQQAGLGVTGAIEFLMHAGVRLDGDRASSDCWQPLVRSNPPLWSSTRSRSSIRATRTSPRPWPRSCAGSARSRPRSRPASS